MTATYGALVLTWRCTRRAWRSRPVRDRPLAAAPYGTGASARPSVVTRNVAASYRKLHPIHKG